MESGSAGVELIGAGYSWVEVGRDAVKARVSSERTSSRGVSVACGRASSAAFACSRCRFRFLTYL